MTDKQIIIDGYSLKDLKDLLFTGQRDVISTKTFEAIIETLERKEQECEEWKLKATSLDYADEICALEIDLKHKEQECEELKEEFKLFQQLKDEDSFRVVELSTENVKLKHQLDLYKNTHKTEQNRRRAFEQTLAEIKEIAEPIQENTCFGMYCGAIDEILKIINEVENV